jgi:hypothetical protein
MLTCTVSLCLLTVEPLARPDLLPHVKRKATEREKKRMFCGRSCVVVDVVVDVEALPPPPSAPNVATNASLCPPIRSTCRHSGFAAFAALMARSSRSGPSTCRAVGLSGSGSAGQWVYGVAGLSGGERRSFPCSGNRTASINEQAVQQY